MNDSPTTIKDKGERVEIIVDDRRVATRRGERLSDLLLRCAPELPSLCAHPDLLPQRSCGLCEVVIRSESGESRASACFVEIEEAIQVETSRPELVRERDRRRAELFESHPDHCPICPSQGDCDLQAIGLSSPRKSAAEKSHSPQFLKRRELSSSVALVEERCIACGLCETFSRDVLGRDALHHNPKTGRVEISSSEVFSEGYGENFVDICPSSAFVQNGSRAWVARWAQELRPTICPGCASGCNADLILAGHPGRRTRELDESQIVGLRPRRNEDVNGAWMCDRGRREHQQLRIGAIPSPRVEGAEVSWSDALVAAAQGLEPLRSVPENSSAQAAEGSVQDTEGVAQAESASSSASKARGGRQVARVGALIGYDATCEEVHALRRWLREGFGQEEIGLLPCRKDGRADDFLIDADRHANRLGVLLVAGESVASELESYLSALDAIVVLDCDPASDLHDLGLQRAYAELSHKVVLSASPTQAAEQATVWIPVADHSEKSGVWINRQSRAQLLEPARTRPKSARDPLAALAELANRSTETDLSADAASVFAEVAEASPRFRGLSHEVLRNQGQPLAAKSGESRT